MLLSPQSIYLVQSETTVGFLSQNSDKLANSKQRSKTQPFIRCVDSNSTLKEYVRVPKKFKNRVRRSNKTTFIYPNNQAIRVVRDEEHLRFLKKFKWCYSSSANETKKSFELSYAKQKADIIVQDNRGFFESTPSSIIKLGRVSSKKIR